MGSTPRLQRRREARWRKARKLAFRRLVVSSLAVLSLVALFFNLQSRQLPLLPPSSYSSSIVPLAMEGGDPYTRALMRTISASEANDPNPYAILYGGKHVADLSTHPDLCITIVSGPNMGDCTTAAGRYQMLTSTWLEKAKLYHPQPKQVLFWTVYSFEPRFQDQVVHDWLNDSQAWGADIPQMLRRGELNEVLRLLSDTWTSLGYGIETNSMTAKLPNIYQKLLEEELALSAANRAV